MKTGAPVIIRATMNPQGTQHLLPIGTRVVSQVPPQGAIGKVIEVPIDTTHAYRIELADGRTISLRRSQLKLYNEVRGLPVDDDPLSEYQLDQHVILRCTMGSRAYGLATDNSDTDTRGVYLPPAEAHWSIWGVPEQLEGKVNDVVFWELGKFVALALKANPNILEVLYSPFIHEVTPVGQQLIDLREAFLSKLAYQTYSGYVISQFKKIEADLRNQGEVKWKHAMHLIRLQLVGLRLLQEGVVQVEVGEHRDSLLAIKRGKWPWERVDTWRLSLQAELESAYGTTKLPERPDYARANTFLVEARRSAVEG